MCENTCKQSFKRSAETKVCICFNHVCENASTVKTPFKINLRELTNRSVGEEFLSSFGEKTRSCDEQCLPRRNPQKPAWICCPDSKYADHGRHLLSWKRNLHTNLQLILTIRTTAPQSSDHLHIRHAKYLISSMSRRPEYRPEETQILRDYNANIYMPNWIGSVLKMVRARREYNTMSFLILCSGPDQGTRKKRGVVGLGDWNLRCCLARLNSAAAVILKSHTYNQFARIILQMLLHFMSSNLQQSISSQSETVDLVKWLSQTTCNLLASIRRLCNTSFENVCSCEKQWKFLVIINSVKHLTNPRVLMRQNPQMAC